VPFSRVDVRRRRRVYGKEIFRKLRSGPPTPGVEGVPGIDCPLDPEPGLGGMFSLGLLFAKASSFFNQISNRDSNHSTPADWPLNVDSIVNPLLQKKVPSLTES
jgi:hypothetical protein